MAGLEQRQADENKLRWESPFPLDSMVLLGGPFERSSKMHDGLALSAVLAPGKKDVGADILDASAEYLDAYQDLIGPYPFKDFTVLEAFFSSGFAFPTCTQIAGSQLSRYKQYRRHGYLDHELLHNWWGNGVLVDPDGRQLVRGSGDLSGQLLRPRDSTDDEEGARKQRRNQSNFLSAIKPEDDLPLGTFGLDEGAGRGIGYQQGLVRVSHARAQDRRRGVVCGAAPAVLRTYGQIQHLGRICSRRSNSESRCRIWTSSSTQWVHGTAGAPVLELVSADRAPGSELLTVTISQGPTDFVLDVPLRLHLQTTGSRMSW